MNTQVEKNIRRNEEFLFVTGDEGLSIELSLKLDLEFSSLKSWCCYSSYRILLRGVPEYSN